MDTNESPYTLEEIMRLGKIWEEGYLANMTVEERLKGLDAKTVLKQYDPEERLKGLSPEQIEAYLQKIKQH